MFALFLVGALLLNGFEDYGGLPAATCGFQVNRALCLGDINCNCQVNINEITYCTNASLYSGDRCSPQNPFCTNPDVYGTAGAFDASHCDRDCNFRVTIDELITIINFSLNGCTAPCYSGLPYPVFGTQNCTFAVFSQLHCQTSSGPCSENQCPSC